MTSDQSWAHVTTVAGIKRVLAKKITKNSSLENIQYIESCTLVHVQHADNETTVFLVVVACPAL